MDKVKLGQSVQQPILSNWSNRWSIKTKKNSIRIAISDKDKKEKTKNGIKIGREN